MTRIRVWARRRAPAVGRRPPAVLAGLTLAGAFLVALAVGAWSLLSARSLSGAIENELWRAHAPAEVVEFYESRGDAPLWIDAAPWRIWAPARLRPEARRVAGLAAETGPAASRRLSRALAAARNGQPADLARAEVALSVVLGDYVRSLRRSATGVELAFLDPDLAQTLDRRAVLDQAAAAPSLAGYLADLAQVNPIYAALRRDLAAYRTAWSGLPQAPIPLGASGRELAGVLHVRLGLPASDAFDPPLAAALRRFQAAHGLPQTGAADPATRTALNLGAAHYERLIRANLERARVLPPAGRRFVLVNPASGELQLYEDGQAKEAMRVVVGTRQEPTPMMAGLLRYLVFNPSWYVPSDLVRSSVAPKVLASGPSYLKAARLQALSDWSDEALPIDAAQVDWAAVAAGGEDVRVRQVPGGDNMMGRMKFMLPNELGIYLHDTPNKAAFAAADRRLSAGCVRVERPEALAAWLLGRRAPDPARLEADQRVDLAVAVPVYITYLTAAPGPKGVVFYPDVYGRDAALLAALDRPRAARRAAA